MPLMPYNYLSPSRYRCLSCGNVAPARLQNVKRLILILPLWVVPLIFLIQGYWPFGILPVTLVTAWALLSVEKTCSRCGAPLHPDTPQKPKDKI